MSADPSSEESDPPRMAAVLRVLDDLAVHVGPLPSYSADAVSWEGGRPAYVPPGHPHDLPPAIWSDVAAWDEADLPARPWIVHGYLLRKSVTLLVGPGGVSKSSLVLAYAVALALGIPLHGFRPIGGAYRSVVYNIEDDLIEQRRRLSAIGTSLGTTPTAYADLIARCGPDTIGKLFARDPTTGYMERTRAMEELEALIVEHGADVVWVDPLAELHDEDENNNTAMRTVVAMFRQMAARLNVCIVVIHHTRKGASIAGDAEMARGAGSIINAGRVALTLVAMTEEEESAFGLAPGARKHFFRVDGGKANYSALTDCEWFERRVYILANSGEMVAVPVPWFPPADVLTPEKKAGIEAAIERGSVFGPWSPKIEGRDRSIKGALVEAGITTKQGQRDALELLMREGFVVAKFRDRNRHEVAGLRAPNGKPAADWIEPD